MISKKVKPKKNLEKKWGRKRKQREGKICYNYYRFFHSVFKGLKMSDHDHEKDKKSVIMSEIMTPDMVNFHGNVHGGHLLSLFDRVAYACASRFSGKIIVTLSVDQVFFKEPIYVGELVMCYASINYVGTTSMEVGIRVVAENLITREARHTNSCYFTMVAVDEHGKPTKVPTYTPETERDKHRYAAALERKKMRLMLNQQLHKG